MHNKAAETGLSVHRWWKDWRGETAALVGSGPSAKTAGVELVKDKMHCFVVNNNFQLAPWADVLYSCDLAWWQLFKGAPEFTGLKLSYDPLAGKHYPAVEKIEIPNAAENKLLIDHPGRIGAGGNSGFQAFNLMVQFGVKRVMLIGIDCSIENGSHWHGRHPVPLNNPIESNVTRWRKAFNESLAVTLGLGIEVFNCSMSSTVTAFPKMPVSEALERWGL